MHLTLLVYIVRLLLLEAILACFWRCCPALLWSKLLAMLYQYASLGLWFHFAGLSVATQHLRSINEAERAIKALEASARTRQIKIDQRAKVCAYLLVP